VYRKCSYLAAEREAAPHIDQSGRVTPSKVGNSVGLAAGSSGRALKTDTSSVLADVCLCNYLSAREFGLRCFGVLGAGLGIRHHGSKILKPCFSHSLSAVTAANSHR
jgi:uncharacterized protein YkvS